MNSEFLEKLKPNFASGLVVFLVALPLCLGIAVASGAPPLSGLIAGIVGGIVVGSISNSNISVSGPAAGLSAIVLDGISSLNTLELFFTAVFIAGVLQLILGFLRAGSISSFFPNNVIEGMLAGIGLIIIGKEIPHALGYDAVDALSKQESHLDVLFNLPEYIGKVIDNIHWGAFIIFLVSVAIIIVWDKFGLSKKIKVIPSALVAVIVGILMNELLFKNTNLLLGSSHLVSIPIISDLDSLNKIIKFPDFSGLLNWDIWLLGATIAVVASIETLLCIEAADKMDKTKKMTNTNLELKAQGVGNLVSSLLGGIPLTSVIVRTSANANSGATNKSSAIIHGILLIICVVTIPWLLNKIPFAVLAAILILIGYKLARIGLFKKYLSRGFYQYVPFLATVIAIVALDLLKGVGIGMLISMIFILFNNMRRSYNYSKKDLQDADDIEIELAEEVSFLNKASIKRTLENIAPNSHVTIDGTKTVYIAYDVLDLLEEFTNIKAKEKNIKVELKGLKTRYETDDEVADDKRHIKILHSKTI